MGSLAEAMAAAIIDRFGRRHWEQYVTLLDGYWKTVRAEMEGLCLDYSQVDLFQDGLPVCGKELELTQKAAAAGSENHQLLLDLVARGASLMGTEDPALLLEEYRNVKAALEHPQDATASTAGAPARPQYKETLVKRDQYMAKRIDASLRPGRIAVLFLGMMHKVDALLPADIVSTRLAWHDLQRGRKGG